MIVISAQNVAGAWPQAIRLIGAVGEREDSRAGPVLVAPCPVVTAYQRPTERVLLDPARDCNPFLHFFESLWMLAGRDDARWLDQFVSDFSARFAEADGTMHGAYGRRWRGWFTQPDPERQWGFGRDRELDQLNEVVRLLRENPGDRQAVIQMWDPSADLGVPGLKDRPCNQQVLLRVRRAEEPEISDSLESEGHPYVFSHVLDITVTCRSNDVAWGCYGSNAVHFSVLHEYLAARIGVGVGTYYQMSNNWHLYDSARHLVDYQSATLNASRPYPGTLPLVDHAESFDDELNSWMAMADVGQPLMLHEHVFRNRVFGDVATPMLFANRARKEGELEAALELSAQIQAPDWRVACVEWIQRRLHARKERASR